MKNGVARVGIFVCAGRAGQRVRPIGFRREMEGRRRVVIVNHAGSTVGQTPPSSRVIDKTILRRRSESDRFVCQQKDIADYMQQLYLHADDFDNIYNVSQELSQVLKERNVITTRSSTNHHKRVVFSECVPGKDGSCVQCQGHCRDTAKSSTTGPIVRRKDRTITAMRV